MAETAAERRVRVARELAELEGAEDAAPKSKRKLNAEEREMRTKALRGDLPLPGVEHRPHLDHHDRLHRQWPPSESAAVPHEEHAEVEEHHARRWPTAHRESN